MVRACHFCDRSVKGGAKGVRLHISFCDRGRRRTIPRRRYEIRERVPHADDLHARSLAYSSAPPFCVGEEVFRSDLEGQQDQIEAGEGGPPMDISDDNLEGPSIAALPPGNVHHSSRMTMSSGAVTVRDTFYEVEGGPLPPGHGYQDDEETLSPYPPSNVPTPLLNPLPPEPLLELPSHWFYPFRNLTEYQLCDWLFESQITATQMTSFFKSRFPLHQQTMDVNSVLDWKRVMHRIPYGIIDDTLHESVITMDGAVNSRYAGQSLKYVVKHRSIFSAIRFLIGHVPFKPNLAYAPVRLYKDEERTKNIFNEMHTGTWWWDLQKTLPPGSTIVPVMIASDKTQLTQHHGDKSTHPVYVTIGNLDKATRRSQQRPSKVLLGFLPIVDKNDHQVAGYDSYEYKRYIHNVAMGVMVKGKYYSLNLTPRQLYSLRSQLTG